MCEIAFNGYNGMLTRGDEAEKTARCLRKNDFSLDRKGKKGYN